MNHALYFDYNGSTPVHPEVAETYMHCIQTCFGNTAASHPEGRRSAAEMDQAREAIAAHIDASPDEIWVGSGGTEVNNWALIGAAEARERKGHLVISAIEHKSVLNTVRYLGRRGWEYTLVDADSDGVVTVEAVADALRADTFLVSVMQANNETGILQPVAEVGAMCREKGILYHCDSVAVLGKLPVTLAEIPADLLTFSSHKMYAPKGCGILYIRDGVQVAPLIHGCGSQAGKRGGTVNMAALTAFAHAFKLLDAGRFPDKAALTELREYLWRGIQQRVPNALRNGRGPGLPNTLNVAFPGYRGTDLVAALGRKGVCVSAGSAATDSPSHVLRSMGLEDWRAGGSLRLSMGLYTRKEGVDQLLNALESTLAEEAAPAYC
ncbi:MAG: cysteine desulfurase family protein [Acidobacteriota bacterium]|nr:cysteine desulfurase family protein [Acidobacteriota bacterium]